jgi:hypothetical protein
MYCCEVSVRHVCTSIVSVKCQYTRGLPPFIGSHQDSSSSSSSSVNNVVIIISNGSSRRRRQFRLSPVVAARLRVRILMSLPRVFDFGSLGKLGLLSKVEKTPFSSSASSYLTPLRPSVIPVTPSICLFPYLRSSVELPPRFASFFPSLHLSFTLPRRRSVPLPPPRTQVSLTPFLPFRSPANLSFTLPRRRSVPLPPPRTQLRFAVAQSP